MLEAALLVPRALMREVSADGLVMPSATDR